MGREQVVWARLALFAALLVAAGLVGVLVDVPSVAEVRTWVAGAGAWGPLLFVAGYAVATLLVVPKNALSAAAGLLFGLGQGTLLVWTAAVLGAAAAFWVGRGLGRDGAARLGGERLARLDRLVERRGALAVLLLRLVPVVPFTVVNYGSGLTALRFPGYLVATAVGILPGTVAYVALGAFGADPTSWRFIAAAAVLGVLSVAGLVVGHRRRRMVTNDTSGRR